MTDQNNSIYEKLKHVMGEKIISILSDPSVYEVIVNVDGTLWVDSFDGMQLVGDFDLGHAKALICTIASLGDVLVNRQSPDVAGEIPFVIDGKDTLLRFQGLLPPITQNPSFNIRKPNSRIISLDEYLEEGVLTKIQMDYIKQAVVDHKNIIVAGSTSSGKTTFLNALLDYVHKTLPNQRIGIVEDTTELQCHSENKFQLRTCETRNISDLLRVCMRLRPDRIVIGEVRGSEAINLIRGWSSGHSGFGTIHANDALSALRRLEHLIQEGGIMPVPEHIAETINVVIYMSKSDKNKSGRCVDEVLEINGFDSHSKKYITTRIFDDSFEWQLDSNETIFEM